MIQDEDAAVVVGERVVQGGLTGFKTRNLSILNAVIEMSN